MKTNKHTEVGEIDSVNGNILTIKLFDNIKSNMPVIDGVVYRIGQIGSFLKISLGFSNVYGIVTQVGAAAIPENLKSILHNDDYAKLKNTRWISLVLVGEQLGKRFERGITQFPTTGDRVHLVTIEDLDIIYGGYEEKSAITVGNISVSESLSAKIDMDRLLSRHGAVLGSTGSGKSNTVSVLLEAIANKNFNSARILVIDPHGEYNETLKQKSKVFKINAGVDDNELCIPFWALPFDELISIFPGALSDTNREYLREKVLELKIQQSEINGIQIAKEVITSDSPIPFSLKQFWFLLDDFERQTFGVVRQPTSVTQKTVNGNADTMVSNEYTPASAGGGAPFLNHQAKGILRYLDGIRTKVKDSRYKFLFDPGPWSPLLNGKVQSDLDDLLYHWLSGEKPITILDLSGVPSEIMSSISGTLLKIVYEALLWGQNTKVGGKKQPLMVVLEEAHSYLRSGEDSISSRTVRAIAKEGRKYGVGLLLVTQRPSELDETVLSQCGTMIALRMNNSKDRSHIKGAIQDELQTIIDLLPSLRTGEGIISGEAVKIPSRVAFYRAKNATKSSDPKASAEWTNPLPQKEEYKKTISFWRRQNFNEESE